MTLHATITAILGFSSIAAGSRSSSLNFQFPENPHLQPFNISVDPDFISDTIQKTRLWRPSIPLNDQEEWEDGPPAQQINALARYWATEYDWSAVEDEINANFSHFVTTVPGSRNYQHPIHLHFVHERSSRDDAIPLLMLHGWPSTHLEWSEVIHPLAHPSDPSQPAFHVVAPDLPGFGFSPAPQFPGMGPRETGDAVDTLMKQLGYSSYGVYSTDLGWVAGLWMVDDHRENIIGHMTDFFVVQPNATDLERFAAGETTPRETTYMKALQSYTNKNSGYADVQRTRPLSLAYAMSDSPVGFAAWVWALNEGISDGFVYSFDDTITSAMMLWIQGTYGNMRTYKTFEKASVSAYPTTDVPTGLSQWGNEGSPYPGMREFNYTPRDWVERIAPNSHTSSATTPEVISQLSANRAVCWLIPGSSLGCCSDGEEANINVD